MSAKGLAGRYAGALYDLAIAEKAIEAVLADLSALKTLITNHKDLSTLIKSPLYSRNMQRQAMVALLKKMGANPLTIKAVGTIAENGRLFALEQVIDAFIAETARRNGQVSAEIISAVPLDNKRIEAVEKSVADLAGSKNISLEMRVDPSLIGGLIVRIGSRLFDTSIKTKLNRLEATMKGVA